MSKTIKQLADELGVSKTAVRKYMTPEFREAHTATTDGNIIAIDEEGCKLIAETIKKPQETAGNQLPETPETQVSGDIIEFLKEQIRIKDERIQKLEARNEQLSDSLLELSGQVGSTLTSLAQEQLADKLIEGKKMANEAATTAEQETPRGLFSFFKKRKQNDR